MMALTIIHTELKLNFAYFPVVVSKMHFFEKDLVFPCSQARVVAENAVKDLD